MIQVPLFVAIHLLGVAFAISLGPHRRPHLCCVFAFPIGLVLWVVALFATLLLGVSAGGPTVLSLYTVLLAGLIWIGARRGRLERRLLSPVISWTAGLAAVAGILSSFNISRFTPDSFNFLLAADVLGADGLVQLAWHRMAHRGAFHPLAHSVAGALGLDYLYAYHAMLSTAFVGAFVFLLFEGLARAGVEIRTRVLVVFVTTSAMMTTYIVAWHVSYIHANFASGIYLWVFVALFWLAEIEGDPEISTLSAVAMVGFGWMRLENGAVAALFLALMLSRPRLSARPLARDLGAAIAAISAWYVLIAAHAGSRFVSEGKSAMIIALLLVVYAYWRSGFWPALRRRIPSIALAAMALGLAWAFETAPDRMSRTAITLYENLFTLDWIMWGLTPLTLVVLAALTSLAPRVSCDRVFAAGIPLYLAFVLAAARLGGPYRVGWGDSGNRMVVHAVPLVFFYLALRLGSLVVRPAEERSTPASRGEARAPSSPAPRGDPP